MLRLPKYLYCFVGKAAGEVAEVAEAAEAAVEQSAS